MSSGVDAPDDLKRYPQSSGGNLDLEDQSVSQSSILYLLQEATKLATPLTQYSSGTEGLKPKGETVSSLNQKEKPETQAHLSGAFSVLNNVQTSSPWEVMSLINLQCERLLHCRPIRGEEGDFYACTSKTDDAKPVDVMESSSFASKAGPFNMCTSTESSKEDLVGQNLRDNVSCSVPHIIDNQTPDELNDGAEAGADLAELISQNATDILDSSAMSEESGLLTEDTLKKVDAYNQPPLAFDTQDAETLNASSESPEISSIDFTSDLVDDKDGNITSISFDFNSCESEKTPPHSPQTATSATDLNNNLDCSKDELLQEPEEDQASSSAQHSLENRRRTPRKQAHPARSPDLQDPELQGVTFSMQTELDTSTDQCRLLITSNYSDLCRRGRRSRSCRSRSLQSSQRTSSSDEESDPASLSKKICASCCTRKTPLWRDAEDGTPLCNACGIRYKKYRVRCLQCWNIPRKEANSNSKCLKCGDLLQLASQHKRAGW